MIMKHQMLMNMKKIDELHELGPDVISAMAEVYDDFYTNLLSLAASFWENEDNMKYLRESSQIDVLEDMSIFYLYTAEDEKRKNIKKWREKIG